MIKWQKSTNKIQTIEIRKNEWQNNINIISFHKKKENSAFMRNEKIVSRHPYIEFHFYCELCTYNHVESLQKIHIIFICQRICMKPFFQPTSAAADGKGWREWSFNQCQVIFVDHIFCFEFFLSDFAQNLLDFHILEDKSDLWCLIQGFYKKKSTWFMSLEDNGKI